VNPPNTQPFIIPSKSPYDVDPWKTQYMNVTRVIELNGARRNIPMMLPIQVVLDTFLVHTRAGKPIDVRVKFNR
jgi:hypothetical protein